MTVSVIGILFQLMKGLAREINGAISFDIDRGTRISLIFSADPLFESHPGVASSVIIGAQRQTQQI